MLVLSRKQSQRIKLGDSIVITVVRVAGDKVRLGIDAPRICWCCAMSSSHMQKEMLRSYFLPYPPWLVAFSLS
jgi:hypothetical protein